MNKMIYELCEKSKQDINNKLTVLKRDVLTRNVDIWRLVLEGNPITNSLTWCDLGLSFIDAGLWIDVIVIYKHMLETIQEFEKNFGTKIHKGIPYHNLGIAYLKMGMYGKSKKLFQKATREDMRTKGPVAANLGRAYYYLDNWDAIVKLNKVQM